MSYFSYLKNYGRGTLVCRPSLSPASSSGHHFLITKLLATKTIPGLLSRIGRSITDLRNGGMCGGRGPIAPPKSIDHRRFRRRYASYRLYVDGYPSRMLGPTFVRCNLTKMVRPAIDFRGKFYGFSYAIYKSIYPGKTVLPVDMGRGRLARVKCIIFVRRGYVICASKADYKTYSRRYPARTITVIPCGSKLAVPRMGGRVYMNYNKYRCIYPTHPFHTVCVRKGPMRGRTGPFGRDRRRGNRVSSFKF